MPKSVWLLYVEGRCCSGDVLSSGATRQAALDLYLNTKDDHQSYIPHTVQGVEESGVWWFSEMPYQS